MKLTSPNKMVLLIELPGPTRKRLPAEYRFLITHRGPVQQDSGCVMTWQVKGGRMDYQISLEKTASAWRWHCTCADAVYRGDGNPQHQCKHVQALRDTLPTAVSG